MCVLKVCAVMEQGGVYARSSSENRKVESEENFWDCLRVCRGETGETLSTHERFEKREDEDEGREKLRTPAGAGEGANSLSARSADGLTWFAISCAWTGCGSEWKSSPAPC